MDASFVQDTSLVGIIGAGLLLTGGVVLLFLSWQNRRARGVERLRRVLADDAGTELDPSLAATWSALVRAAEDIGSGSGLYASLADKLTRAGWVLNPTEFLLLLGGLSAGAGALGWVLDGALVAVLFAVAAPIATYLLLSGRADRYSSRCDEQLPEALGQMGSAMRSGHSLQQALEGYANHGSAPLAGEFARVLADTRVGRPLDDALLAMGERVGSTDLRWAVRAMLIQRRTGGKLAEILDVLAEFMHDRMEIRREVRALTAEGKISAIILMALPFVVLAGVLSTNATYLQPMLTNPLGRVMIIGALGSMGLAWFLIRGIIKVEV